jgi:ubiquinone/menaquinone biosynthesis C-methylase UbiE
MNPDTVSAYSKQGSQAYEESVNKDFLYGKLTVDFLKQIEFFDHEKEILDIGCGTAFAFDVLDGLIEERQMKGIGIEPAVGMLKIAKSKYKSSRRYRFLEGSFEHIPLPDQSVDKVISTLALHWVADMDAAVKELKRVLKADGSMDILMIARDDGFRFKRSVMNVLKNHLSFAQIIKSAGKTQRLNGSQLKQFFLPIEEHHDIQITEHRKVLYGTVEDYLALWKARSRPVICEVKDQDLFFRQLREELKTLSEEKGVPFDISYLCLEARRRKT